MNINWGKHAEQNVVDNIEQMRVNFHILGCGLTKLLVLSEVSNGHSKKADQYQILKSRYLLND